VLLSARGSSTPQQRRSLPAASAASRSAAPVEQPQRSLASAARAIFFFFLEGCDLLGLLASCPSLFFFFGHLLGSCCWGTLWDTEGVKRVIWGSGAWVADASILKNVWIDIAYSAWQNASVKPAVAKMAVNVRSAD